MTSARAHNTSEDGGEPCVRVSGLARTGPGQPAPRVHPGVLLLLSRVGFASVASDEWLKPLYVGSHTCRDECAPFLTVIQKKLSTEYFLVHVLHPRTETRGIWSQLTSLFPPSLLNGRYGKVSPLV